MKARLAWIVLCTAVLGLTAAHAQVNVTTWHNDIGRTGQNLNETILNTSNVTPSLFGKLFAQTVDGQIYAQPLYLSGITINGATHNVVFVATENDSVYAFDADTNGGVNAAPLWQQSMLTAAHGAAAGAVTVSSKYVGSDINPQVGITGTPVIDPTTNTLYVVSKSLENGNYPQRLHALDVTTGNEKFGGPILITATVAGTGNGSVNGSLTFDSLWENQRPGLLLLNGIVYVGFSAHGDNGPWHGWILGYNAATLQQTGAYCSTPNGTGAGFWMSGEGLAADQLDTVNHPFGRMFVPTGNGDYNATAPYNNTMDFGDSHLNLDLTNGVPKITDEFTTNQQANLDSEDGDVGSGGMMVIPTQTTGPYPHLAVQVGKAGTMFLLNRDNMGGYNTTADQAVQEQLYATPNGAWSTTAYWNGNVYLWGRYDTLRAFKLSNGLLSTAPTQSSESYNFPGSTPSISANGNTQGIVWSINSSGYATSTTAILQAHDANNVNTTLYSSATNAARDSGGIGVKFTVPTVVNGKVYVGTASELDIFGLLNGATQTNAPAINPGTETFTGTINVAITDATPGASIYYTTNGTPATVSSTLYTGPIAVSATETINAVASATGLIVSVQTAATFTNNSQTASVVFSVPTGTYSTTQSVTLSDATPSAVIYYTLDGTTPTSSSAVYSGALTVSASEVITAFAVAPGLASSPVIAQTYNIQSSTSGISFSQGFAAAASVMHFNGSTQLNDTRLQLTDGATGEEGSAWYINPVNIQSFTTDFTFQLSNPASNGITFTIQNAPQFYYSLGGNGYALGYAPIPDSAAIKFDLYNSAGEGPDSTGLYLNGANPTVPSINLTGTGIDLHSDDTMAIHLTYNGTTLSMTITDIVTAAVFSTSWTVNLPASIGSNTAYVGFTGSTGAYTASQKILTWTFNSGTTVAVATPTFTPVAGTYSSTQSVTIADATSGASIYYTTNGTTPTASSTQYIGPLSVSSTETLKAIAVSGSTSSSIASAAYTITLPAAATPTFSVAAGAYSSTQTVAISDATSGATIYYTTNGTTPTTASTVYSGPVTVSTSETLSAVAISSTTSLSAVGSAAYIIKVPAATPTFSLAAGTYTGAQTVNISDSTSGASIYYTLNGTTPTPSSSLYTGALTVSATETIEAIAISSTTLSSATAAATYTINQPAAATPVLSLATGTYTGTQTVTITDTTSGATIYYTTNGTTPTTASTVYSGPLTVSASETLSAVAISSTTSLSAVTSAVYTIKLPAATPVFSLAAGAYTGTQTVSISDATTGASIYYTLNGSAPTTSSTLYAGPLTVSSTETIKAIAISSTTSASAVASALYTINPLVVATPIISPGTGTYADYPSVTMSDATAGSTIYYTTNGTTPTTASAVYSTAISVNAPATVNAIAVASSSTSSTVTAVYTLTCLAPTVSPVAGTYASAQTVTITRAYADDLIYYTTNGVTPTASSTLYTGPITVSATQTLSIIALKSGFTASPVVTQTYTISATPPTVNFASGFTATGLNLYGATITSGALQLTDGNGGEGRVGWYTKPVNVQKFTTDFTFQQTAATADGFTFTIQNSAPGIWAVGGNGASLGYGGIGTSVAVKFDLYSNSGEGIDSTGFYLNGAAPTLPSVDMTSSGLNLHSGDIMHAHLTYDGTTLTLVLTDTVTNVSFTTSTAVNIPTTVGSNTAYVGFTGSTGGLTAIQKILTWSYTVNN